MIYIHCKQFAYDSITLQNKSQGKTSSTFLLRKTEKKHNTQVVHINHLIVFSG